MMLRGGRVGVVGGWCEVQKRITNTHEVVVLVVVAVAGNSAAAVSI
jgi:hypothetical protein